MKTKSFLLSLLSLFIAVPILNGCTFKEQKVVSTSIVTPSEEPNVINELNDSQDIEELTDTIKDSYVGIVDNSSSALTKNIISKAFALLTLDITAFGLEVYTCQNVEDPNEVGFCYVDMNQLYKETTQKQNIFGTKYETYVYYFESGFISLDYNKADEDIALTPTEKFYKTTNNIDSDTETIRFMDTLRIEGQVKGHFVLDKQYIIYELVGDTLKLDNKKLSSDNFDLSLGSIYNYDIDDYMYIPLDEIPDFDRRKLSEVVPSVNPNAIREQANKLIAAQNAAGVIEYTRYVIFLSATTFDMLNGLIGQQNSVNDIAMSYYDSIEYDPATEYLTMNPDGSVSISAVATPQLEQYHKSFWEWTRDILIVAGGVTLAVVISVASVGSATWVSGAIIGATVEYGIQTLICQKPISEVNWAKVGLAALFGTLGGAVPIAHTLPGFVLGTIESSFIGGLEGAVMRIADGETDTKKILKSAIDGALIGAAIYGVRQGLSMIFNRGGASIEQAQTGGGGEELPVGRIRKTATTISDSPSLEKVKNIAPSLGDRIKVSASRSVTSGGYMQEVGGATFKSASNKFVKYSEKAIESFVEYGLEM